MKTTLPRNAENLKNATYMGLLSASGLVDLFRIDVNRIPVIKGADGSMVKTLQVRKAGSLKFEIILGLNYEKAE